MLTEENPVEQDNLFGTPIVLDDQFDGAEEVQPLPEHMTMLTDQSSLTSCVGPYRRELMLRGKSNYTVTCFLSDLKMLMDFLGSDIPVGRITKENVTDWLMKLKFGNPVLTPAPKTMARRVTFLKNFFTWLEREHIIQESPAAEFDPGASAAPFA